MPTSQPLSGQLNALGYTVYDYRYAAGHLSHLPGFNGELPDTLTGHYLLGNGYRAFNPVLMRFNSPDSLSPFGEAGINAYCYCQGNPVGQIDPSGHWPVFRKLDKWLSMTKPKAATNIREVTRGIISFEKAPAKTKTLTVLSHGTTKPAEGLEPMHLAMSGGNALTTKALQNRLIAADINTEHYDRIKLMFYYSGSGGADSFAAAFARLTNKPVKGYKGLTFTNLNPQDIKDLIALQSNEIRKLSSGTYERAKGIYVYKKNVSAKTKKIFNYEPVNFTPL